jgi:hypothetical protein
VANGFGSAVLPYHAAVVRALMGVKSDYQEMTCSGMLTAQSLFQCGEVRGRLAMTSGYIDC